jgi:hypothetical protein
MTASRFPCRVCGQSTEGVDVYVVCSDCVAEYDRRAVEGPGDDVRSAYLPPTGPVHLPLTAGEVEARLRKMLDDW